MVVLGLPLYGRAFPRDQQNRENAPKRALSVAAPGPHALPSPVWSLGVLWAPRGEWLAIYLVLWGASTKPQHATGAPPLLAVIAAASRACWVVYSSGVAPAFGGALLSVDREAGEGRFRPPPADCHKRAAY